MGALKQLVKHGRQMARRGLEAASPKLAATISAIRVRRLRHRINRESGKASLDDLLIRRFGDTVLAGPFEGMRLPPIARHEHVGPWLLGSYEGVLHAAVGRLRSSRPSQVIDIGANVGYYAVGLARAFPGLPSIAFDIDPWARRATLEMATANGVNTLAVLGWCSPQWLAENLKEGALIVCDIDGGEASLLGNHRASVLASATLLIEVHDYLVAGTSEVLIARFSATHTLTWIEDADAPVDPSIDLSWLPDDESRHTAAHEWRPSGQRWLVAEPKMGENIR